jgi:hypothetical protein
VASSGFATPTTWPTRSCATAVCPCGEPTIMSAEGANLFKVRLLVGGDAGIVEQGSQARNGHRTL